MVNFTTFKACVCWCWYGLLFYFICNWAFSCS